VKVRPDASDEVSKGCGEGTLTTVCNEQELAKKCQEQQTNNRIPVSNFIQARHRLSVGPCASPRRSRQLIHPMDAASYNFMQGECGGSAAVSSARTRRLNR
jgi:hypothetical protein